MVADNEVLHLRDNISSDLDELIDDISENNEFHINITNSPYFEIDEIPSVVSGNKTQYCAMHINIQSLPAKFEKLKDLLAQLHQKGINVDFLLICETFLNDQISPYFNIPGYNLVYKNRQNKSKGGVAIFIDKKYNYCIREDLSIFIEGEFESVFLEICSPMHKLIIGEIYRVPNTNIKNSIERFELILEMIKNYKHKIILGTDQNFDLLKLNNQINTKELLNIFYANKFIPCITKPTPITHSSATLIDNIYLSSLHYEPVQSGILLTDLSDHLPVFVFCGKYTLNNKPISLITTRSITPNKIEAINERLNSTDWNQMNNLSANDAYMYFNDKLQSIVNSIAPEKNC